MTLNSKKLFTIFLNSILGIVLLFLSSCNYQLGTIKGAQISSIEFLNIVLPSITVQEGTPSNIVILYSKPVPENFTLRWTISGAGASADFPSITQTQPVMAGANSSTIIIPTRNNFTYEGSRTYTLTLESTTGAVVRPVSNDFTIDDDELPGAPTLSINDVTLNEGNGAGTTSFTFTVTPSFLPTATVSVDYNVVDGTATAADSDFSGSGTITLNPGDASATITIDVTRDSKFEIDETFSVVLSGGSGYSALGSDLTGLGTITNDDVAPTIAIDSPTYAEGSGGGNAPALFTVNLSAVSGVNTTVNFSTVDGTATIADSDYVTTSSTLTIPAGSLTGSISVPVTRDNKFENDENFSVNLSGGSNYTLAGSVLLGTATITNDDAAPTISLSNVTVVEGSGVGTTPAVFTVTLSAASGNPVTVNYATSNGTATTADTDYTSTSGLLTIPPGSTSGTITVAVNQDTRFENTETFTMTLSGGAGYTSAGSVLSATGTITNDDTPPTISISSVSANEGTGGTTSVFTFTVTSSAVSGTPVTFNYTTADGTATDADNDYTSTAGIGTIAAGSSSTTITVPVVHDAKNEASETFTVTLSGGAGYTVAGSTLTGTGTITNDDVAPTVSINSPSIVEGNGGGTSTLNFTVTLSTENGVPTVLNYATTDGTATIADTDYVTSNATLTIPAGSLTGTISINIFRDAKFESNENFTVTLSGGSGYTAAGSTLTGTGTITNDDSAPTISIANVTANEGTGGTTTTFTYTVSLSSASGQAVTVDYATSDGTATVADSDYANTSGTLTIPAGSTSGTFNVLVTQDAKFEATETFNVTLSGGTGYTILGSTLSATGTITNDDSAPTISIASVTANEGTGGTTTSFTFTVTSSAVSGNAITANFATSDGTALLADNDYTSTTGTATIAAGSTTATFNVPVIHDEKNEDNETFTVTLSGGAGYTVAGSTLTATGTITNDDTRPTITINSPTVAEGNGAGTTTLAFTVSLSAVNGVATIVNYATSDGSATLADSDYLIASGTLTIPAGSMSGTINITVVKDSKYELDETINVTLSGGSGYKVVGSTLTNVGTITNDDTAPTISVANVTANEGNGAGTTSFAFTVTLSSASGQAVTADYTTTNGTATTADNDYTATTGTLTIPAGSTTGTITVPVNRDAKFENNETFTVTLSNGTGYTILGSTLSGFGTITNDDTAPTISIANVSAAEGTGGTTSTQTFTVTASAASGIAITFNYATSNGTATIADNDYVAASGTGTITAGTTTTTIAVAVNHDSKNEANETYTMTLSGGAGYTTAGSTLTATGTITNDDTAPTVQWSVASQSATEAATTLTLTAQLSAVSGQNVSVPYTVTGTATGAGTDYTITASPLVINAGSTSASISVTIVADTVPEANETVIVTIGTPTNATVGTNSAHTVTINDDDISAFTITGVRSTTTDTIVDEYLNYQSAPRFVWASATGAASYDVTVFQNDGTTVMCALQNTTTTTFSPASCTLVPGTFYKVKVTAKNQNNFTLDASNSPFTFYYNQAPVVPARGTWYFTPGVARTMNIIDDDPSTVAIDPATDADGDTLTVTAVGSANLGTRTIVAPQSVTYGPQAEVDGTETFNVVVSDGKGASVTTTVTVTIINQYRWVGLGADTNWNTNENWCGNVNISTGTCTGGGTPPGATNTAWFGPWCANCNAVINAPITIGGLWTATGYAGTITQNVGQNVVIGQNEVNMKGGTFAGATDANTHFTVQSDFRVLSGSTFQAPSGNLSFAAIGNTARGYNFSGTFIHNNGTVRFDNELSAGSNTYGLGNIATNGGLNLYKLVMNMRNTNTAQGSYSINIVNFTSTGDVINVETDYTGISGTFGGAGVINVKGNVFVGCATKTTCAATSTTVNSPRLNLVGPNDSVISIDSTFNDPSLPVIGIKKDNNFVRVTTSSATNSIQFAGLEIEQGEFIAPTQFLTLGKRWVGSSIANKTTGLSNTGGIFTHSNGTVRLFSDHNTNTHFYDLVQINTPTPTYLYNLILEAKKDASGDGLASITVTSATRLYVMNTIEHKAGVLEGNGAITLLGPSYTSTCSSSTVCNTPPNLTSMATTIGYISFEGSAPQTYSIANGTRAPRFRIKKDSLTDTVSPAVGSGLTVVGIHLEQGTLNLPAYTNVGINIQSLTNFYSGIYLAAGAGNGQINHNNGTVELNGKHASTTTSYVISEIKTNGRTLNLYNLTVNNSGGAMIAHPYTVVSAGDYTVVNNNFDVTSGYIKNYDTDPITTPNIELRGNISFQCASANSCSALVANQGLHVAIKGGNKSIYQAAGAANFFKQMTIDLTDNTRILTLQSHISGYDAIGNTPFTNINLVKGNIDLFGFFFDGLNNINIAAGTACSAPLGYVSATGVTGSGCGP